VWKGGEWQKYDGERGGGGHKGGKFYFVYFLYILSFYPIKYSTIGLTLNDTLTLPRKDLYKVKNKNEFLRFETIATNRQHYVHIIIIFRLYILCTKSGCVQICCAHSSRNWDIYESIYIKLKPLGVCLFVCPIAT